MRKTLTITLHPEDLEKIDFARNIVRRSRSQYLAIAGLKFANEIQNDERGLK